MSALRQPAPPPADGGGAGPGAPAPTTQQPPGTPGQQAQQPPPAVTPNANDPWGFAAAVANAPEHLRSMLQTEFTRLTPQLDQRFQRYQHIDPMMDRLTPLLLNEQGQPSSEGNVLDGLLGIYELFQGVQDPEAQDYDPNTDTTDDLMDWWEQVGEQFDFFGDERPAGGSAPPPATSASATTDLSALPPELQAVVGPLLEKITGLETQLGEFQTTQQNSARENAINAEAQKINTDLQSRMKAMKIDGADDLNSENATDILRLALTYAPADDAVEKAVADFMRLKGLKPPDAQPTAGLDGVAALQAALNGGVATAPTPQPSAPLGGGSPNHGPEQVHSWQDASTLALQRLREQRT